MDGSHQLPLVGRDAELAAAVDALGRLGRGTPAALLVRGEAGIGKSRLASEVLQRASRLGHVTLVGRADELDHAIPYAVFRDLLSRLVLDDELAGVAADVEAFRLSLDGAGADDEQLARVFSSALRLFRAVTSIRTTVLLIEDIHFADPESLALAATLVRLADVPLLTIVTTRTTDSDVELERLLVRMVADGRGAVLDLQPLDVQGTSALVGEALAGVPDARLADAVFHTSRGNPFYVRAAVQSLVTTRAVVVDRDRARLVAEAPVLTLTRGSLLPRGMLLGHGDDVELAKVIAVFGRFQLRHLALARQIAGQAAAGKDESFDRLVKAGILIESASGGYEFAHSILRNTLYDELGAAQRRRVHGAIAEALLAEQAVGLGPTPLELATHVAASAEPGDERAARLLVDAGRAMAASAPLVAAEHHRRAVELLPHGAPLRAEALAFQARSLHVGARTRDAATTGLQALRDLPPGPLRRATAGVVVNDLWLSCQVEEARRTVGRELVAGGDPCPLLAQQVDILLQMGQPDEAHALLPAAITSVTGRAHLQLIALSHLLQYTNHIGRNDLTHELLARLDALAEKGSPTVQLAAHEIRAFTDWQPGLVQRVQEQLDAAHRLRPDPLLLGVGGGLASVQARVLIMRGRWDEALAFVRNAAFDLRQRGIESVALLMLAAAAEVHVDQGDVDEAVALAGQLVTPMESMRRLAVLVQARIDRALGRREAAYQALEDERRRPVGTGSLWKRAEFLAELCELLVEDGRAAEATEIAGEIAEVAATTGWLESQVASLRCLALVLGDADAAREYAAVAEREGWALEQARAALLLGELGVDQADNLTLAYKLFDGFGAAPWRRRTAAALRAAGRAVPRRPAQPHGVLTETEVQLARLVHQGLSNQQVATAMHYSLKTIEVYLSRVYTKTGHAGRLELIRAVDSGSLSLD